MSVLEDPTTEPPVADVPFSQRLREATAQAHTDAEASTFVHRLMAGELDAAAYGRLLAQLRPVYRALETNLAHDPVREAFTDPRLLRLPAIETDLAAILGPDWRDEPVHEAAASYAEQVCMIGTNTPAYVGHHYTRYLGDLSGGQAIARRVSQNYGLTQGEPGLLFYRFDGIDKPKLFKDDYRAALDNAPWDQAQRAEVIEHARAAFAMNAAIFASLD